MITYNARGGYFREFLLAVGFSSNLLAYLIEGFGISKIIVSMVILLLVLFDLQSGFKISITRGSFLVSLFIYGIFVLSFMQFDYLYTQPYFLHFILYSFFAFFSVQRNINFYKLMECLAIILFLSLPVAFNVKEKTIGHLLGVSYSMLIGYLVSLFYLFLNKRKTSLFLYFICMINIVVCSFFYLLYGNRGAVLMIMLYLFLKWFLKYSVNLYGRIIQFISLSVLLIAGYNWLSVLSWINSAMRVIGINVHAFEKTLNLLSSNQNLDSGRNYLISKMFSQVNVNELIVGKGIGYVESVLETYSHNLFIQSIFEGGLLFLFIFIFVMVTLFKLVQRNNGTSEFLLIGIVGVFGQLMLSSVYWFNPIFWFLFYVAFYPIEKLEVLSSEGT